MSVAFRLLALFGARVVHYSRDHANHGLAPGNNGVINTVNANTAITGAVGTSFGFSVSK